MEEVIGLVAVIGTFTSVIVIAYLFFSSRHKVRMALIQHGKEASIFKENRESSSALKYGMLMAGLGLGILMGTFIESILNTDSPIPHFSMMLILGGAGLVFYYLVKNRRENHSEVVE